MTQTIRVLLADDHPLIRAGIRTTLTAEPDLALVGEAVDGQTAQALCQNLTPDILLLDLNMPGPPAVETVTFLRDHCPRVRVIVLTAYDDTVYVRGMLAVGAWGYVLKDEAAETVVTAIRQVAAGQVWFSPAIRALTRRQGRRGAADLTDRELSVVRLLAQGKTNKDIARQLEVSEKTVEFHVSKVLKKLGAASRTEAALWAKGRGMAE